MADEERRPDGSPKVPRVGGVVHVLGAIVAGGRRRDPLIRAVAGAGVAGVLCLVILHYWSEDRKADRAERQQQHVEALQQNRQQHLEDLQARHHADCVIERMTGTVRAAIWKERPPPLESCNPAEPRSP